MGELLIDLVPSMLGLMITPAAIAGAVLLLGTTRPFANAASFMAGFLVAYAVVTIIVAWLAGARTEPLLSSTAKAAIELGVGVVLLALAALQIVRRGDRQQARRAGKSFVLRLTEATPPLAFGVGLSLAVVNPNVPILIAGLAAVAAADGGHLVGAVALLLASVVGILLPMGWRWLMPETAARLLNKVTQWIAGHDRIINVTVLVAFGIAFTAKGWAGL